MPGTAAPSGVFKIYSYSNQDDTNINTQGDNIDVKSDVAGFVIGAAAQLSSSGFFDLITDHIELRGAQVGPLSVTLQSTTVISEYTGFVKFELAKTSVEGGISGFVYESTRNFICYFTTSTNQVKGCSVVATDQANSVKYVLTPTEDIPANTAYVATLSTLEVSGTPGVTYPTNPGLFLIHVEVQPSASVTMH
jgi:hypothetical protein